MVAVEAMLAIVKEITNKRIKWPVMNTHKWHRRRHYAQVATIQSPTFSFEFVPIPRLYPSAATYAHPRPPIA